VAEGAAQRSWGVQVAKLAGVPAPVLRRAAAVLAALEARAARGEDRLAEEMPLFARPAAPPPDPLAATLAGMDVDAMSPREALEALYGLKALAAAAHKG
ncbi:MAG: DNA mismatch repair protein MutS, partial [Roseococcus sp.]